MEVKCKQFGSTVCRTFLSYLPSHLVQFIFLYLWIFAEIKVICFYWVSYCVNPPLHVFPSHPPLFLLCWTKVYVTVKFFVWKEGFFFIVVMIRVIKYFFKIFLYPVPSPFERRTFMSKYNPRRHSAYATVPGMGVCSFLNTPCTEARGFQSHVQGTGGILHLPSTVQSGTVTR